MMITAMTWMFLRQEVVVFGVLHLIGLSIIIAYFFLNFRYINLYLGMALIVFGVLLQDFAFNFQWLIWLGFIPKHFYTLDYFPIIPWFGLVLIGLFLGNMLYRDYRRHFNIRNYYKFYPVKFFCILGKNSLLIYLVHVPIIIAFLHIFGFINVATIV
jgi:uncharacterized membrane protein